MKRTQLKWAAALLALAAAPLIDQSHAATLKVGDPAPKLQVFKWIQGEPVKEFARSNVYIVEFWATWCGPCRVSIPHLNELHTKFKDQGLIVIGQDILEQDPDLVAPFVKKMGGQMTYRVALDTDEGAMAKTWMDAAGQEGIPTAFIINKAGLIVWIGHPMQLKEELLKQVLGGTFDLAKASLDSAQREKKEQQLRALWKSFNQAQEAEQWEQAESTLANIERLTPEDERLGIEVSRFNLLLDQRDFPRAYKLAGRISDQHMDDAMLQNGIAWTIATKDALTVRDLNLAEKIAHRAEAAAKDSAFAKAEILDTLARVLFLKGDKEAAIQAQQRAVEFAEGRRKTQFAGTLADYKAGRVPRDQEISALRREIERRLRAKAWGKAESAIADLEKLLPEAERHDLDELRFRMLVGRQDYAAASKMADRLTARLPNNAMDLNELAWRIVIAEGSEPAELALAETIAREANRATKDSNAEILDTLARVLFLQKNNKAAIECQEKAVQFAKGRRKGQFKETLESYRGGNLPKPY